MRAYDYNNAISVVREIFWVGFNEKDSNLHCNPYLLIDKEDIVFFDPGSFPDFPTIMRKVLDIVRPENISLIVASHQDPDVCGNIAIVEDVIANKALKIAAHSNTARLIQHYGLVSDLYRVDEHDLRYRLKSGRELTFIHTPYLHSPGAIVTYDKKTKSLFTSDLFGAVSKEWSLFAEDDFLPPMAEFHQLYMPSNAILRPVLERLERLEIDRILPQHGSVLEGDQVPQAIAMLKELPCGIDLA